jgi:DNA-binding SARP family transcriptional activator
MTDFSRSENRDNRFLLTTLGAFRLDVVDRTGTVTGTLSPGKPLAVIAYLAATPNHRATRDRLCDLLWSDRGLEEAKKQLRQSAWLAKRQLGASTIASVGAYVQLGVPVISDAELLSRAAEAGDLQAVIERYTGDFLAQFGSPGAREFEQWAELERLRFQAMFSHAAEALARSELDRGRSKSAEAVARKIRDMLPNSQLGWRLQLEALAAAGEAITARAEADHFDAWLRAQALDAEPASAAALRVARKSARPNVSADGHLTPELIGRDHEFSAIHSRWSNLAREGGQVVRITAPSGLGKSRLVADLFSRIRSSRGRAVIRRANPGDRQLPFSLAAALAGDLAALPGARGTSRDSASVLVALNPSLSSYFDVKPDGSEGDEALRRRSYALIELISAVASEAPVAIIIDDLHWADAASRQLLELVAARIDAHPVLLVATSRRTDGLRNAERSLNVLLTPLTRDQTEELLASIARLPETSWAVRLPLLLVDCSDGNPLIILESLRLCIQRGALRIEDGRWVCPAPEGIAELMQQKAVLSHRLDGLPELEFKLLALTSLTGLPTPKAIVLAATNTDPDTAAGALAALEQRGFVSSVDDTLTVSHDAVAEATLDRLSPDATIHLNASLGAAMLASDALPWRNRAAMHFADARHWAGAAQSITPQLPRFSSRRDLHAGVLASLGDRATPDSIRAIVREVPKRARFARPFAVTAIGVGLLTLGGAAASVWSSSPPPPLPDAVLMLAHPDNNGFGSPQRAGIRRATWDPSRPIPFSSFHARSSAIRVPGGDAFAASIVMRPGSDEWAETISSRDSGGVDIAVISPSGRADTIVRTHGDDRPDAFAPDGSALLFETTRWSRTGQASLAILDMRTLQVRRLTHDRVAGDGRAVWSPSGARILFSRTFLDSTHAQLCTMDANGAYLRCHDSPGKRIAPIGWLGPHVAIVGVQADTDAFIAIANVDSGKFSRIAIPYTLQIGLDPTARWLVALIHRRNGTTIWQVAPSDRPELIRPIETDDGNASRAWFSWKIPPDFIQTVSIRVPTAAITRGVPTFLDAKARTRAGRGVVPDIVRWRSLKPSVAIVDSTGQFIAADTGYVTVEASVGGWRMARRQIHVGLPLPAQTRVEDWTGDVQRRWRFFGDPLPSVKAWDARDSAFFVSGEGTFFSGGYSRDTLSTQSGLSVEARLRLPVNRDQYQYMELDLLPFADPQRLAHWDHRTGYMAAQTGSRGVCSFTYPAGEGISARRSATPIGLLDRATGRGPLHLGSGEPFTLRMQVFPDGRCGYAINGMPVLIVAAGFVTPPPVHIVIQGNSVGSRMLVGRIVVKQGVPADIDWTQLRFRDGSWRPPGVHLSGVVPP